LDDGPVKKSDQRGGRGVENEPTNTFHEKEERHNPKKKTSTKKGTYEESQSEKKRAAP